MIKTLTRHNDEYVFSIDKSIMEELGIGPDTPLKIDIDDGKLIMTPAQDEISDEEFAEIRKTMHSMYGKTFEKLAK